MSLRWKWLVPAGVVLVALSVGLGWAVAPAQEADQPTPAPSNFEQTEQPSPEPTALEPTDQPAEQPSGAAEQVEPQSQGPVYYIDGARPSRVPGRLYKEAEGCVPYSPERPDTYICGELPAGLTLGPEPGGYDRYPGVCNRAYSQYVEKRAEMKWPDVIASSCYVVGTSRFPGQAPGAPEYLVSFDAADPGDEAVTIRLNEE